MTWKNEIKKEEPISNLIGTDLHKLGNMLLNYIRELSLDEGDEDYVGKDRSQKIKKLKLHLVDALDVVEELVDM